MWRRADAAAVIKGLAAAEKVVLGLDVRRYLPDGRFYEVAWSALPREHGNDPGAACATTLAALDGLDHDNDLDGYEWVLVTW
jgi:hypothetical protein